MPKNLELKIYCSSFSGLKKTFKEINAEFSGELIQKDVYYKNEKGLLKLRIENGEQSLIKYLRDEEGKDRWSDFHVLKFSGGNAEEFLNDIFESRSSCRKEKTFIYV